MKNVPNLRFKEFSGEWKQHALGDIFDFYTTNSFSRDFLDNDKGRVKNIHYGDIHMKFPTLLDVKNTQIPYVKEAVDLSKISIESYCKNGDVVIADASEDYNDIGKAIELKSIGEEKIIAGLHTILARDNKGIMVNGFKGYLMNSPSVRKQIKVYAAGAKVLGISKANISKVKLLIPSGMEQEKIAAFFSLIDKKIELQTEKVEELKNYKKGLMQKIFSQELRFKDENGNEYPEWEHTKLSQVAEIYQPQTISQQQFSEKGYPVYGANGVIGYFTEYNHLTPQIAVTCRGNTCGTVNLTQEKSWITGNAMVINTDNFESKVEKSFLFFLLQSSNLSYMITGSGQPQLTREVMNLHKIWLPCIEEQIKISHLLSALTNSVQKETQKLSYLQEYKKGLLQQMFI